MVCLLELFVIVGINDIIVCVNIGDLLILDVENN